MSEILSPPFLQLANNDKEIICSVLKESKLVSLKEFNPISKSKSKAF